MPRKKSKRNDPITVEPVLEPPVMIEVDKKMFQYLHSCGRSLLASALKSDNHSAETLLYLTMVGEAVDYGHQVLGTQRGYADAYINVVGGITALQAENAKKFL